MLKLYHGCSIQHVSDIMRNIELTRDGFHMSPDIEVAAKYGRCIICFEVGDFECYVGTVDKTGDAEADLKSGLEYVLKDQYHLVSFYNALERGPYQVR